MPLEQDVQILIQQTAQLDATIRAELEDVDGDISRLRTRVTDLEIQSGMPGAGGVVTGGGDSPSNPNAPIGNDVIQFDELTETIWVWNPQTEKWVELPFSTIAPPVNIDVSDILDEANAAIDAGIAERVDALAESITETALTTQQTQIDGLAQQIETVGTATGSNTAAIQNEVTARTDAVSALAQQLSTAVAQIDSNHQAFIEFQSAVAADPDGAAAVLLTAMQSKIDENAAAIVTESETRASETSALSQQVNTLTTTVGNAQTAIQAEVLARTSSEEAIAQTTDSLASRLDTAESAIQTVQTVTAGLDEATVESISTVTSTVDGLTASVQDQATAINGIKAQRILSVNSNGQVTGIELVSGGNAGSQIKFQTPNFILYDPSSGNTAVPFSVTGGVTKLTQAMIGSASIDTLHLAGNAVTATYSGNQSRGASMGAVSFSTAAGGGTSGYTQMVSLTVNNPFGENVPALVMASGRHGTTASRAGDNFAVWTWNLKHGSSVISHAGVTAGDYMAVGSQVTLSPGNNYFYLNVANITGSEYGSGGFVGGNITVMAAAR